MIQLCGWSDKYGPRDRHKTEVGRTNRICDFDASPNVVARIIAVHQRNRALRDRDAHSKGAQTSFVISMLFSET
jgi:hypothetical protein